jgi:hypothetical protein
MASEQWLLNDTSVANGAYWTAAGATYKLKNTTGATKNRVTSSPTPIEGSGCYASDPNNNRFIFETSASVNFTGTNYIDFYVYFASTITGNVNALIATGNDTAVEYSWADVKPDGAMEFSSFDLIFGTRSWVTTSSGVFPDNEWVRVQVFSNANGVNTFRLFKGLNLNGTSPDTTITKNFNGVFGSYEVLVIGQNNNGDANTFYFDSIKFDNTDYPTRLQVTGSPTGTATGTAAMSNARTLQASATGTATGTAAASNQRALAASATGTASGTAAMSSTQAMSASATATATGTAAGSITAVVTIDGAGTGTASATAGASSTQLFAGSATVTATGTADASIRPIATVDGVGTITATGTTTFNKSQTLAATATATATASASMLSVISVAATATATASATAAALITTPGTLYGNAQKVAGLYGSSTKPTLTTRS